MIDISIETPLSLAEAAKVLPGRPHLSTVWRFATRGVRGVRLSTFVSGGRRFTTLEETRRFVAATTAAANSGQQHEPTQRDQEKAMERAKQHLHDKGFYKGRKK